MPWRARTGCAAHIGTKDAISRRAKAWRIHSILLCGLPEEATSPRTAVPRVTLSRDPIMIARPIFLLLAAPLLAQDAAMAPALLPGKGLAQHDFFYAGEQKQQQMFIVRKGKVAWSYLVADSKGEISDAVRLSNG